MELQRGQSAKNGVVTWVASAPFGVGPWRSSQGKMRPGVSFRSVTRLGIARTETGLGVAGGRGRALVQLAGEVQARPARQLAVAWQPDRERLDAWLNRVLKRGDVDMDARICTCFVAQDICAIA